MLHYTPEQTQGRAPLLLRLGPRRLCGGDPHMIYYTTLHYTILYYNLLLCYIDNFKGDHLGDGRPAFAGIGDVGGMCGWSWGMIRYVCMIKGAMESCTDSSVAKDRLSDAGGPRFESQTGRVTDKSTPSLWRDEHPAIKGLQPPEHHAGHSIRTETNNGNHGTVPCMRQSLRKRECPPTPAR